MPRLRATTTLSLLALWIGVLGTQWLCTLTDQWVGPPPRRAPARVVRAERATTHRRTHAAPHRVSTGTEATVRAGWEATPAPPPLVPLSTPPTRAPYARLRGHLDGRVVLDIATDGSGRVTAAGIAHSSGDPVLDAYALDTVRRWRFAVPAAFSNGVHGELPMRFDSDAQSTPP